MKGNENIKELILEDIQNKGELFSSLKVNSNYNQELFVVENIQKNSEPNEAFVNKEEEINANNNNIKKEKKNENESNNNININNNINNINIINNSKESSKANSKRKTKKKLVMIKNEFSISDDKNINNLNINIERDMKLMKDENENKSDNQLRKNVVLHNSGHKENPKLNPVNVNIRGSLHNTSSKISNIKLYNHHSKNKNNEVAIIAPLKHSQDNIKVPLKEKTEKINKKNLTTETFKEMKSNDENETGKNNIESDEEEDSLSFDSLIKEKKNNKFEKKNNKMILVKKHLVNKPNISVNSNKNTNNEEISEMPMENIMKIKRDNKGRIYSIKIKNDPVWCVLSMKNNEYISTGLASGIIRIFSQSEYNQKMYIKEHTGAIYSMYLTKKNSNCFLTSSTDKLIKKILISDNFTSYTVISKLKGHNSSVYKAIELNNNQILSCSDDGFLIIWENHNKNEEIENKIENLSDINNSVNNISSHSSNFNKLNFINDFLNIESNSNSNSKKNVINKYVMNKKLNQMLSKGEIIYDILQINSELFISSSLYGNLRFWNINTMTNTDTISEIQCNDSHNCLCIINKSVFAVLLNGKYGVALIDYIKKEVTHKIIIEKNLEIKLSTILLTSNKLVVIGGQNNSNKEESHVIYKFYKIIKVKKANSTVIKYSLKFLNEHIKKCQKVLVDDDIWLNAMTEGGSGTIINGLGSTYINKEYGQIYIFFREIKNLNELNKEGKNSLNDINRNKK